MLMLTLLQVLLLVPPENCAEQNAKTVPKKAKIVQNLCAKIV